MLSQLLYICTSIIGGLFTGFLAAAVILFVVGWFGGAVIDPIRFAIQAVVMLVFFAPGLYFLCTFVLSDWLLATSAFVSFLLCLRPLLREEN